MSLKFEEALKILVEGLPKPSRPEHQMYTQDAAEISEKINQELVNMNSVFKGSVSNWEDTCTYILKDIYKLFIPFLRINLPFEVEPQRIDHASFVLYNLKTSANHPAVENGYVDGLKLTKLFYWDMRSAVQRLGKVNCKSGKAYSFDTSFTEFENKQFFKILAKENEAQKEPSILYQFNLLFTFSHGSLTCLFFFDYFHLTEHHVMKERAVPLTEMVNKLNILLLPLHLDSSLTVIKMHNILTYIIAVTKKDKIEEILLEVMTAFTPFVQNPGPLNDAIAKLMELQQADSVQVSELKAVLGLQ